MGKAGHFRRHDPETWKQAIRLAVHTYDAEQDDEGARLSPFDVSGTPYQIFELKLSK